MKLNKLLLLVGLAGLGVVGATQTARTVNPEAATTYWANGQMQSRMEQRDGVPDGKAERWHANGSKQAEGDLSDGRMEGAWQFWSADGTPDPERTGTYRDGQRIEESPATNAAE